MASAGAGPDPIPQRSLTVSNLSEAIRFCLSREAIDAARNISMTMREESGVQLAANSFHRNLPIGDMCCDLLPQHAAVWKVKVSGTWLKISKVAAEVLIEQKLIRGKDLKM